jgi:hypothetical protein
MVRKKKSWSYIPSKNTPQCLTASTKHKKKKKEGNFEGKRKN